MEKEQIYHHLLRQFKTEEIMQNEPMSKHTSFRVGGMADFYIIAKTIEDIKFTINLTKEKNIPLTIVGNGTNLLVKDGGIRGIVLKIGLNQLTINTKKTEFAEENKTNATYITVSSGVSLSKIAKLALENSLTGLEFAYGIPGTIGGAIRMNAGAYGGEIKDVVISSTYIDENLDIKTITGEEHEFEYRNSIFSKNNNIIVDTIIKLEEGNKTQIENKMNEYLKSRKEKQPLNMPNAGSTFKRGNNYITAKLIDECGLKGYCVGGAQVSEIHSGFIVNKNNATAKDILDLIEYIKIKIKEKFKENIELEIIVLGEE